MVKFHPDEVMNLDPSQGPPAHGDAFEMVVPEFQLNVRQYNFQKVSSFGMEVKCARTDATSMRELLALPSQHFKPLIGTFLPNNPGMVLGDQTVIKLLTSNNARLAQMVTIPVTYVFENVGEEESPVPGQGKPTSGWQTRVFFVGRESTSQGMKDGRYLFVTSKDKRDAARNWIDNEFLPWRGRWAWRTGPWGPVVFL